MTTVKYIKIIDSQCPEWDDEYEELKIEQREDIFPELLLNAADGYDNRDKMIINGNEYDFSHKVFDKENNTWSLYFYKSEE